MVVRQATAGMKGADINSVLSADQCAALKEAGLSFVMRYAPRKLDNFLYNLTNAEQGRILAARLGLAVVQHVSPDNWTPTADLGKQYGEYMANYCLKTIQLVKGVGAWLDLEMVKPGTPIADTIGYATEWWSAVNAAGYNPGLYCGYQPGLSSDELYRNLPFQFYWRSYNYDDGVTTRGYCLVQHPQQTIAGLQVDPDTVQADNLGGLPMFLYPS